LRALECFAKSAKQGNATAQLLCGLYCASSGFGARRNTKEAVFWISEAANQGNPVAQYYIGTFYFTGYGGLRKNKQKAIEW
jgi:TPR repeat protein